MEVPVMPEPMMTVSAWAGRGWGGGEVKEGWGSESQKEDVGGGLVVGRPGSASMRSMVSCFVEVGMDG